MIDMKLETDKLIAEKTGPLLAALKRIAAIPLYGEPITDPAHGDKQQLALDGEYDIENDSYEPCCGAESEWLRDAVEIARAALGMELSR